MAWGALKNLWASYQDSEPSIYIALGSVWLRDLVGFLAMRRPALAPQPPELPVQLDRRELSALSHDIVYAEIELANTELADQHANGVTLTADKLTTIDLSGSQLEQLRVTDSELKACNLANARAPRTTARRISIDSCRLTGIQLTEATLCDVTIRDSRVDLASFGFSRLTRVTFEDCALAQSDFLEAQLESVRFHRCDLTKADFRGARLRQCEFRRSELTDLEGIQSLRGAAMEWPDIVAMVGTWAAALGIGVLDPE